MLHLEWLDFHVLDNDYVQGNTLYIADHILFELVAAFHKGKQHLNQETNCDVVCKKFLNLFLTVLWARVWEAEI